MAFNALLMCREEHALRILGKALDEVAIETARRRQGAFQIDRIVRAQAAKCSAGKGFRHDIELGPRGLAEFGYGQADTIHGDAGATSGATVQHLADVEAQPLARRSGLGGHNCTYMFDNSGKHISG